LTIEYSGVRLRPATEADFDGIIQLVPSPQELFWVYPNGEYPLSAGQLRALAGERLEFTVAIVDGQVVGFANLYDVRPEEWAFIGNVVIDRTFRGKGFGRTIVKHMATLAFKKYDLPEVRISVFNQNTRALLLYASMNFQPYAVVQREDPSGNPVALIHLKLSKGD
jgi:RimJ/RimL family protein N-acetyltransferase